MKHARQIIDALGRQQVADRLELGMTTISCAYVNGVMPAKWFAIVEAMAKDAGVDCPREAFSFKPEPAFATPASFAGTNAAATPSTAPAGESA